LRATWSCKYGSAKTSSVRNVATVEVSGDMPKSFAEFMQAATGRLKKMDEPEDETKQIEEG